MREITKDLAKDFKRWGIVRTRRVQTGVEKYGVILDAYCRDGVG